MDTTPQTGTVETAPSALSFDEGISAIDNLLSDDLERDTKGTDGPNKPAGKEPDAVAEGEEPDLVIDDDDADETVEVNTEALPVVDDNYEVEIDGEKIPLGELKRGNLRQRDYSKKTEELARERDALRAEAQNIRSETEKAYKDRIDFINQYAQKFIPQKPVYDPADPIGYLEAQQQYELQMHEWEQIGAHFEAENKQRVEQEQRQFEDYKEEQRNLVYSKLPKLKDEKKRTEFLNDVKDIGFKEYGIKPEEFSQLYDARYYRILHDAIQYRKAVAKQAGVKEQVSTKPVLKNQQRMNLQTAQSRDRLGRFEEARKRGSIDAVARSIEDLID